MTDATPFLAECRTLLWPKGGGAAGDAREVLQARLLTLAAVLNEGLLRLQRTPRPALAGVSAEPLQRRLREVLGALDELDGEGECALRAGPAGS
jgi:hypothetical protein